MLEVEHSWCVPVGTLDLVVVGRGPVYVICVEIHLQNFAVSISRVKPSILIYASYYNKRSVAVDFFYWSQWHLTCTWALYIITTRTKKVQSCSVLLKNQCGAIIKSDIRFLRQAGSNKMWRSEPMTKMHQSYEMDAPRPWTPTKYTRHYQRKKLENSFTRQLLKDRSMFFNFTHFKFSTGSLQILHFQVLRHETATVQLMYSMYYLVSQAHNFFYSVRSIERSYIWKPCMRVAS